MILDLAPQKSSHSLRVSSSYIPPHTHKLPELLGVGKQLSLAVEQVHSSALELKAEGVGLTLDTLLTKV